MISSLKALEPVELLRSPMSSGAGSWKSSVVLNSEAIDGSMSPVGAFGTIPSRAFLSALMC